MSSDEIQISVRFQTRMFFQFHAAALPRVTITNNTAKSAGSKLAIEQLGDRENTVTCNVVCHLEFKLGANDTDQQSVESSHRDHSPVPTTKLRSSRITQANANTSTPQIVPAVPNKSPIPSSPASQLAKQLRDAHINSPGGQSDQTRQHTHSVPSIANLRSATHVDQPTPMEIDDVEATNQLRQQGSAIIVPTDNPTKPVPKRKAGSNHGHVGKSKKARQDVAILSNN
jgi:hypothetical protein